MFVRFQRGAVVVIKLKVKKLHPDAKLPQKNNSTDAVWDLFAIEGEVVSKDLQSPIRTGLAFSIPKGYFGLIKPRSGMSLNNGVSVLAGVIDSGFHGEVRVILTSKTDLSIKNGDKVAQMVILPLPEVVIEEVRALPDSDRGIKGFGSSGK